MSINEWGPLTWIFFHTMAEKIKDNYYDSTKIELLLRIGQTIIY